jgi:hypothetical protein
MMKIAVTSQNFRTITGHAGKTRRFLVYEAEGSEVREIQRLDLPKEQSFHELPGDAAHPIDGVDVLIPRPAVTTSSCVWRGAGSGCWPPGRAIPRRPFASSVPANHSHPPSRTSTTGRSIGLGRARLHTRTPPTSGGSIGRP